MPSRLSSLLVRDGIIAVKRMERAFQRQVIYGGALDTILLEMSLIDETTLCRYLSAATGLPTATPEQLALISSEATELCPEPMANRFHVAPLAVENEALRVLVSDPIDFAELEDLADELDMAIQPLVAPEFRFHLLFSRAFGLTASARFTKLAEMVGPFEPGDASAPIPAAEEPPPASAAGGVPEPIADEEIDAGWTMSAVFEAVAPDEVSAENAVRESREPEPRPAAADEGPPMPEEHEAEEQPRAPGSLAESVRATLRFSSDSVQERLANPAKPARISDAYRIVRPLREAEGEAAEIEDAPAPEAAHQPPPVDPGDSALAARGADRFHGAAADGAGLVSGEIDRPDGEPGLEALSVESAQEQLAEADDRDQIFELLLRAVATRTGSAALVIIQGRAAMGRFAIQGGQLISEGVSSALIPLDPPSPFHQVASSASPYIGKLASGRPEVDEQVVKLTDSMPPSALLLPIALRERVVAIVVGYRGGESVPVTDISALLPLAGSTAEALIRLIRAAKKQAAAAARAATELAKGSGPPRSSPRLLTSSDMDAGWDAPDLDAVAAARADEIDELLDRVESSDRAESGEARRALLGRGAEVVPRLDDRFPGRLDVDRYEVGWRTIRASQYGPLMALVVELGAPCGPMLAAKLGDPRRDVRYYAAVCAAELRPAAALEALVQRLFDRDYGVRDIAIHALRGYPSHELDAALGGVRAALHSQSSDKVVGAANAVAVLADLRSIPHLLDVLEGEREPAAAARRALRRLTCQDFGWNVKKWRAWWDESRERSRIEWLLDALGHKDEELRRQAAEDLRSHTGESFGFSHDAPRREREEARELWLEWWERDGRQRFESGRA